MAYVHCHSCPWSQDDFWNKHYNPFRFFFKVDVPLYIYPKYIVGDPEFVKPTAFTQFFRLTRATGYMRRRRFEVFSWFALVRQFLGWLARMYDQVWWTDESWEKVIAKNGGKWPPCPKCGAHDLDID